MAKWTDEHVATLRRLWEEGLTGGEIAQQLPPLAATPGSPARKVNRNMVIGKARRLGLPSRPSPLKG